MAHWSASRPIRERRRDLRGHDCFLPNLARPETRGGSFFHAAHAPASNNSLSGGGDALLRLRVRRLDRLSPRLGQRADARLVRALSSAAAAGGGMIFGSVCSGIEGASVAWAPLGWRSAFMSEIEPFARAVLAQHYPGVPLHGDFTTIRSGQYRPIELLVGGTPCQSFSVAGLRGGMADARGNLALEYLRLADRLRPRWLVWENVPGVRSSNGGRDFGAFLGGMGELGYGWAYASLDAQYFGLAQRRERVFAVGYTGDWRRAAAVLFEPASLRGDSPPRRKAWQRVAGSITASLAKHGGSSAGKDSTLRNYAFGGNNTAGPIDIATAVNAHGGPHGRLDFESETFVASVANPLGAKKDGGWRGDLDNDTFVTHALRADGFDASEDGTGRGTPKPNGGRAGIGVGAVQHASAVRRLTPAECERLQGYPAGYTDIVFRGKPAADGHRYKALGNSFAVPVVAWIGRRIAAVEAERLEVAA